MSVLKVTGLTKYYGKTLGIENVSFSVEQGEVFGFLGSNGAGKTTTNAVEETATMQMSQPQNPGKTKLKQRRRGACSTWELNG